MKDYYGLNIQRANGQSAVRLISYDGAAPLGTISDIREVKDADATVALERMWDWFVGENRLELKSLEGKVYPYRGKKTFVKAALELIDDLALVEAIKVDTKVYAHPVKGMASKYITKVNGVEVIANIGEVVETPEGIDYTGSDEPEIFRVKRLYRNNGKLMAELEEPSTGVNRSTSIFNLIIKG